MSTTAKSNATTRRKPTQSAQERPAAQVVQFPLFAPKPRQTAPQEIQVVVCECGADAVRVRLLPDPAAVLHPSPDEVQDTFTAPLSWLAAHPPAIYRYSLRPEIGPDFPYDRVGASAGYPWQAGRMEVPVYEGLPHPLWGLTARITWWLLEQYGDILTDMV